MKRSDFLKNSGMAAAAFTILPTGYLFGQKKPKVRLGFIGVGMRGQSHVEAALLRDDCTVMAVCDVQKWAMDGCRGLFKKHKKQMPKEYLGGFDAYKKLIARKDIDAVIISTPWEFHRDQAVDAMNAGKYVGCEVNAGLSLQDHWDIVNTSEQTGKPYMTLENVCYRRDVLAALNMVRKGIFGELIHLEGGYQHDLRKVLFNDGKQSYGGGVEFGPKAMSEAQWRTQHNVDRQGNLYPTHGVGPLMMYADINKGNRFTNLVSFSSKARGLANYVEDQSPGHSNAKINYKNGDVTTTMINCANGETVMLSHDVHLPRPYSCAFRVQGTKGLWMDVAKSIHIEHQSKEHAWDPAQDWFEKYDHPLWVKYEAKALSAGHGGMDWFVFHGFIEAVKAQKQTPIDVYDSVTMSAITPLSEASIKAGNTPQEFPDFTNGKWQSAQNTFALDARG